MHNGVVSDFSAIKRELLNLLDTDAYENVHGTTDSEHMAALYITYLTQSTGGGEASWNRTYTVTEMMAALTKAFESMIELQKRIRGPAAEANSLNVCCSDGQQLIAVRFRNHTVEQPPSLYWSKTAGITLNRMYPDNADGSKNANASRNAEEHGSHVIVASEPTTYNAKEWELIKKNCAVLVDKKGGMRIEEMIVKGDMIEIPSTGPG
jgi:glutamine amidotransferase